MLLICSDVELWDGCQKMGFTQRAESACQQPALSSVPDLVASSEVSGKRKFNS